MFRVLLGRQGHQSLEGAGHQISAGDTAQKSVRGIPDFQWVEDVEQILLQGVALVDKGESDQHIAVNHLSGVIDLAAPARGRHGADG